MRIAIVINTAWNIYNFRAGMIKAFINQGFEVIAIAPKDEYAPQLIAMGCDYLELPMDNKGANPAKDIFLLWRMYKLYKKSKADVFLQYTIKPNIYGTMVAKWLNKPVINNVSGLGTIFIRQNLVSKIGIQLYRIAFKHANKVFFQNENDLCLFLALKIIKKKKTGLLPGSGVDLKKFQPSYREQGSLRFVMASRLLIDKGVVEYVKAAEIVKKEHPDVVFTLCGFIEGFGVKKSQINAWQQENIIDFVGSTNDIKNLYEKHDIVVLPSYREGTPKSLLEAAAMAKPIITTNVPGCREVVKDSINGFLCEAKDPEDLASKMKKMISLHESDREKLGMNGRQLMEKQFDQEIVIGKYLEAIKEVSWK